MIFNFHRHSGKATAHLLRSEGRSHHKVPPCSNRPPEVWLTFVGNTDQTEDQLTSKSVVSPPEEKDPNEVWRWNTDHYKLSCFSLNSWLLSIPVDSMPIGTPIKLRQMSSGMIQFKQHQQPVGSAQICSAKRHRCIMLYPLLCSIMLRHQGFKPPPNHCKTSLEINNHPNFLLAWSVSRMSVSITSASGGAKKKWKSGLGACGSFLSYCFLNVFWLVESSEIAKWIKMIHDVLMMIFRESKINKNIIMLPSFWRFVMFGWLLPSSGPRGLRCSPCYQQDHVSRESQQPKHHLVTWIWGCTWLICTGNIQ